MSKKDVFGAALSPNGDIDAIATAAALFPPITSEGFEPNINEMELVHTDGSGRAPSPTKRGGRYWQGPAEGACLPATFPIFLTGAMGDPVTTQPDATNAPSVYKHTYDPKAPGKKPRPMNLWTVIKDVEDFGETAILDKYIGALVNELAINVEANNYARFSAGYLIKKLADSMGAEPTATRDTTSPWSFSEVLVELAVNSQLDSALTPHKVLTFSSNFGNNINADNFGLGSIYPLLFGIGNIAYQVEFTAGEAIGAHYRRFLQVAPEQVRLRLTARGRQIGTAGAAPNPTTPLYEELQIDIRRLEYTNANTAINASETLQGVPITARGVVDTGGEFLTVSVQNENNGTLYRPPTA